MAQKLRFYAIVPLFCFYWMEDKPVSEKNHWIRLPLRVLAWSIFTLVFLFFTLLLLLLYPPFQTFVAKKAAERIGNELKTDVSIGKFSFNTNGSLAFRDVLIRDQYKDSLLYVNTIDFNIREIGWRNNKWVLQNVQFGQPYLHLYHKAKAKNWNYDFLMPFLSSGKEDTTSPALNYRVTLKSFQFVNARIYFQDFRVKPQVGLFNPAFVRLDSLYMKARDFYFRPDSSRVVLDYFRLKERSGLRIDRMRGIVSVLPLEIRLDSFLLRMPRTRLEGFTSLRVNSKEDWKDPVKKAYWNCSILPSVLGFRDFHPLAIEAQQLQNSFRMAGKVKGYLHFLKFEKFRLAFGRHSKLIGDGEVRGLPKIDSSYFVFKLQDFQVNTTDIHTLIPKVVLPAEAERIAFLRLKGDFNGLPSRFLAKGDFETGLGNLKASLQVLLKKGENSFSGNLNTPGFDLGKLLAETEMLGSISFNGDFSAKGNNLQDLVASLDGTVFSARVKNYTYSQVGIKGTLDQKVFTGSLFSGDPNANLDFNGRIDMRGQVPEYEFTTQIRNLNFLKLGLMKDTLSVKGAITLSMQGNDPDNLIGQLDASDVNLELNGKSFVNQSLSLQAIQGVGERKGLHIRSDVFELDLDGVYRYKHLGNAVMRVLSKELKLTIPEEHPDEFWQKAHLTARFFRLNELASFLGQPKLGGKDAFLEANFERQNRILNLDFKTAQLHQGEIILDTMLFRVNTFSDSILFDWEAKALHQGDSVLLDSLRSKAYLHHDSVFFDTYLAGKENNNYLHFRNILDLEALKTIHFLESDFQINSHHWSVRQDGSITLYDEGTLVENLAFTQSDQKVLFHGMISEEKADSFIVDLTEIDLQQLNPLLESSGTSLEGYLNSHLVVNSVLKKPVISGQLGIEGLVLDGERIGDMEVQSFWNTRTEKVEIVSSIVRESDTIARFNGFVGTNAERQDLDLSIDLMRSTIHPLEKILKPEFTDISGFATSHLHLYNTLDNPLLEGYMDLENARIRVDYLNTFYNASSRILFSQDHIDMNSMAIRDDKGNKATLTGRVLHDYFRNTRLDLRVDADNIQVLNTDVSPGALYYGTGIVSGYATFTGHISRIDIDVNATTKRGTNITIPFGGTEVSQGDQFVVFLNRDTVKRQKEVEKVEFAGLNVKLAIKANPDAIVTMILDPIAGDFLKGKGVADLKMEYNRLGEFKMFGDYNITEGDYLFTLQNIINKRFRIQDGSQISWTGDPYHAQLKVNAIYSVKTYVKNLLNSESMVGVRIDSSQFNRRFTVDTYLKMTGDLMKPDIATEIKVQGINENDLSNPVSIALRTINNNEQEMNRQIFGLMILGSFISDNSLTSQGVSGGLNSASELLSNQLSNWISKYAGNVNVGINYREQASAQAASSTRRELQLALNTSLFNNRVIIDGSLDVGNDQIQRANQTVGGDFQIEYKVTEDGRFRVKAFNKIDDRVFINKDSNYRQGVGISLRRDYDSPLEIIQGPIDLVKDYWKGIKSFFSGSNTTDSPPKP